LDFQIVVFGFSNSYFEKKNSTEVVTRLTHDEVVVFKTFCGTAQSCARQTINQAAFSLQDKISTASGGALPGLG